LLDPPLVEDDPGKWGFITRLTHLDDMVDGNSPFKLYKKTEDKHFKLETGEVEAREERSSDTMNILTGIGVEDIRFEKTRMTRGRMTRARMTREVGREEGGMRVLIDPMTKEIISKVAELDEDGKEKLDGRGKPIYIVNDHWFILNVKFLWKDAPAPPVVAVVDPATAAYPGSRSLAPAPPAGSTQQVKPVEVKRTSGRQTIGLEEF